MRVDHGASNMRVSSTQLPLSSVDCGYEENYTHFVLREIYAFIRYLCNVSVSG
jgi:hypothetical protein